MKRENLAPSKKRSVGSTATAASLSLSRAGVSAGSMSMIDT